MFRFYTPINAVVPQCVDLKSRKIPKDLSDTLIVHRLPENFTPAS